MYVQVDKQLRVATALPSVMALDATTSTFNGGGGLGMYALTVLLRVPSQ